YAATRAADAVAAIDPQARTSTPAATALDASGLKGSSPNALAVDATAGRIYVANAGENAVQAFDLATMTSLGRIPTGWYPTAVAVLGYGTGLIASGKGMGVGPHKRTAGPGLSRRTA